MKTGKEIFFRDTLEELQRALSDWEKIPDDGETEMDKFKKRTQELLRKLSEQIKALDQ